MLKKIRFFLNNSLVKNSLIVLIGSTAANVGTYVFHLLMGRILGPVNYGILESLISLSYFLSIPIGVLGLVVAKYVSQEIEHPVKMASLVKTLSQKVSFWGVGGLVVFFLSFFWLKKIIRVDSFFYFAAIGVFSYLSIYTTIFSCTLQGIMQFSQLNFLNIFNSWSKLLVGFLLVALGFQVGGALAALIIAAFFTLGLGYFLITRYLPFKNAEEIKNWVFAWRRYSLAVFLTNLSLTSLYTSDVVLARYFLPPQEAGYYAALSVLGKIIFFASSPITTVMFPTVSAKQAKGKDYRRVFETSIGLVIMISLVAVAIYFLFPNLMINLLYGRQYLAAAGNLGVFAIFISLYSLCAIFLNYFLSIARIAVIQLGVVAALGQIFLIVFFHQNIGQILSVNILVSFLLFLGLLICYY